MIFFPHLQCRLSLTVGPVSILTECESCSAYAGAQVQDKEECGAGVRGSAATRLSMRIYNCLVNSYKRDQLLDTKKHNFSFSF